MHKKLILMLSFGLLFVTGCGKVPQLKNGEEVFLQVNGKNVSANDIYNELKEKYARDEIIETIDKIVLEDEYEEDDDSNEEYPHDDYDNDEPTYGKYSGSYAQDVLGYSDDDIDTIFDGDPNAYWNID